MNQRTVFRVKVAYENYQSAEILEGIQSSTKSGKPAYEVSLHFRKLAEP